MKSTSVAGWLFTSAMVAGAPCMVHAEAAVTPPADVKAADASTAEIIVTGQKLGAGKSRATFELDKSDIADRPLGADITQSLNKVPGVKVTTGDARGGSFSFEIAMRGLMTQQIGLSIDGISTGDARFNGGSPPQRFIESSNIANIVVSQSAGDIGVPSRFALGGSVDFRTDDPSMLPSAVVEGGVGSDAYHREYFRVDTGELAHGLTAYGSFSNEYNDNWAGPKNRYTRKDHYEFKVVKKFDDGSFLKGRVVYNNQFDNDFDIVTLPQFHANPHSDGATDVLTGIPNKDLNFGGGLGGKRKDFLAYINGGLHISDAITLTVNPYYQTLNGYSLSLQNAHRQLTGSDPTAVLGYNATGGAIRPALITTSNPNVFGGPSDMRVTPRDRQRYGVTGEIKIADLIPRNTFRIGGWWDGGSSTENRNFYEIIPSTTMLTWQGGAPSYVQYQRSVSIQTTELYAQDSLAIIPDVLRLDAGVTWFHIQYKARSPLEYSAHLNFSQNSPVQPKIALSYKPLDHVELFGGYARNFSGISEDAFLGSTAIIAPGTLKPLTTENYDAGVRYTRQHFAISVEGFHVNLKNNIGIVPNDPTDTDPIDIERGNVATRAANISGEHNTGFDVSGLADFGWINAYASYSYQDAKYASAAPGSVARLNLDAVGIIAGTPIRDVPKNSAFGDVEIKPLRGVSLQVNARYIGSRVGGDIVSPTFQEITVERIPGYTVFGAFARYTLPPTGPLKEASIQFNVDNIFNKAYLASVTEATATATETGLPGRSLGRYFVGAPRTYTVSLRTKF